MRLATGLTVALCALCSSSAIASTSASGHRFDLRQRRTNDHAQRSLSGALPASAHPFAKRDASTYMASTLPENNEGEDHSDPQDSVPKGARLTSIDVGSGGEQIATYITDKPENDKATHAFIMIHGKLRNGAEYWTTMNNVLQSAIDADYKGVDENAIVIAPQFYSTKFNEKQYSKDELAWPDVNAWQAGDPANHPKDTKLTSIDALDSIIDTLADTSKYPALTNVTVVGHGGGGQLGQRYATIAKNAPTGIHIRYIHGDPSSGVYFTKDRPLTDESVAKISDCPLYNTWRYGFDNFTGTADGLKTPKEYFQQYISRDVVSIVGYQDTASGGDQYCMALLQGGVARRDRNLAWWQYINTLARTNEDLTGFPGNFSTLPDWSDVSQGIIGTKLVVVEDADHDAELVFESDVGRAALFDADHLPTGWRPKHWVQKPAIKKVVPTTSSAMARATAGPVAEDDQDSGAASTFMKLPVALLTVALAAGAGVLCL